MGGGGWLGRLGGVAATEEEVCWEQWCVEVVVARPRTEIGELDCPSSIWLPQLRPEARGNTSRKLTDRFALDRIKVRRAMESSLQKTALKIVGIVNRDKDHIPPITTTDANPFPYRIVVNPKHAQVTMR